MAFPNQAAFTKKVTDLPDKPSPTYTAADIKTYMQTPADELKTTFNALVDKLNSTAVGDSGAGNLRATAISGLTGSNVQTFLEGLKTLVDTKTANTGNHLGTWQGFTPTQVDQTLNGRLDNLGISVASFGADDTLADNSTAFKNALIHIRDVLGKGKLIAPAGKVYKFTLPLGSFHMSNIIIDLQGSTLDFSAVPTTNVESWLEFKTSSPTGRLLTAHANKDAKVIACDTTGYAVGDMVKVYSEKIWDSTRTSTRIGEISFIQSIDSTTQLTLTTPLHDNYNTTASASIAKLEHVKNIALVNGQVIGPNGNDELRGFRVTRGLDIFVQNINTKGVDVNQMQFTDCVRVTVNGCFFNNAFHASMAYGISFADASRDCICSDSHFTDVRHSLSTNNNVSTSWGITRRIWFVNNTVTDSAPATEGSGGDAIDSHAGSEDIFIINNSIYSSSGIGINIEANRAIIKGNRIRGTSSVGIQFLPKADSVNSSVEISENKLTPIGDGVGSDYGILCNIATANCENIVITNNEIDSPNTGIRLVSSNGYRYKRGSVSHNPVKAISGYGVDVNESDFVSVVGNSVEGGNFGIHLNNSNNCTVSSNPVNLIGVSGTGYGVRVFGTSKRNSIGTNTVKHSGTLTTSHGVKVEDTATYNMVVGNVTENVTTPVTPGVGAGNVTANNI